jgi:hypothetical protein
LVNWIFALGRIIGNRIRVMMQVYMAIYRTYLRNSLVAGPFSLHTLTKRVTRPNANPNQADRDRVKSNPVSCRKTKDSKKYFLQTVVNCVKSRW